MSEGHIFLSYRSLEANFARQLANDLMKSGIKVWMDKLDGIVVGDISSQAIDTALKASIGLIAILTTDYFATSFVCSDELVYAYNNQLPLYPILLRDIEKKHLPFWLQNRQYLDLRAYDDPQIYKAQVVELVKRIKQKHSFITEASTEQRYLDELIRELGKAGRGVLQYVELEGQASTYSNPFIDEGWDPSFALLAQGRKTYTNRAKIKHFKSILDAINWYPKFVLIGQPGAGKTTTIRKLAWDTAQKRVEASKEGRTTPLPLLLYLPQWDDEDTPIDFIRNHWPFDTDIGSLLVQGDVVLYLDGLNEMGATGIEKTTKLRQWLNDKNAPQNVIVTCRAGDYVGDLKLGELPTVLAEEMDESQIKEFTKRYLGEKAEEFLAQVLPENYEGLRLSRNLFELAKNPYLLAALIYLYQNEPSGDLPQNNGKLFQNLVQALWAREGQRSTLGWMPFEEIKKRFGSLAFAMIKDKRSLDVPINYVLRHIQSEKMLEAAQNANLIEIRDKKVRFHHQLIQEYFAATDLFYLTQRISLADWVLPARFGAYRRIAGIWDQVIIALSGIVESDNRIIDDLSSVDPWLATDCANSGIEISHHDRDTIIENLEAVLNVDEQSLMYELYVDDDDARWVAAQYLGIIGGPKATSALIGALADQDKEVSEIATSTLLGLGKESIPILVDELQNTNWDLVTRIRIALALETAQWNPPIGADMNSAAIYYIYIEDYASCAAMGKHILPFLLQLLSDEEEWVNEVAIGIIQSMDIDVVAYLLELCADDDEKFDAAITIVAGMENGSIMSVLKEELSKGRSQVRHLVATILGEFSYPDDAFPELINCLDDKDVDVRYAAASALNNAGWDAMGHKNEILFLLLTGNWRSCAEIGEEIVPQLTAALNDPEGEVYWGAIAALVDIGTEEALHNASNSCIKTLNTTIKFWGVKSYSELALAYLDRIGTSEALAAIEKWKFENQKWKRY